jgi:hypothetical protein
MHGQRQVEIALDLSMTDSIAQVGVNRHPP